MGKTKKRKALELEALLVGVTVTYDRWEPKEPAIGDRWYDQTENTYFICTSPIFEDATLMHILGIKNSRWISVSSKRFFDLSDITK